MNRFNTKKIILVVVLILLFVSMATYFAPRYGWRLFGFRYCADPSTIFVDRISIDYNDDFIELFGDTSSSAAAYVGAFHKLDGNTLYVGMKYNYLTGFTNRDGRFVVHIPIDTEKIERIMLKGNQSEKHIWTKGGPAPEPQE